MSLSLQFVVACSSVPTDIPASKDFGIFLTRDLNSYFQARLGSEVEAQYELLRAVPTIVGTAFPKYYAWVEVFSHKKLVKQGAVRLAAISGKKFEVTDYIDQQEILTRPESVSLVFPKALCDAIILKANVKSRLTGFRKP
ncbi:MAG: hypothetical protein EKK48_25145 [Candidatus Melainabacteria bacterium]|nr:MAG: hypothetical protein EKK48_25145 [Candidatus Melainabacteria bacterium]